MGGSAPAPQLPPGNTPIPVGQLPMFGQPTPNQQMSTPGSVKSGALAGMPSLQDIFSVGQGAPPLFPNSQSFPQQIVRSQPVSVSPFAPGGPPTATTPGFQVPGAVIPATPTPPVALPPQQRDPEAGGGVGG